MDTVSILQEGNIYMVSSKNYLSFTWKFDEHDLKAYGSIFCSKFNMEERVFQLQMKVDIGGSLILKLHNSSKVNQGYYMLNITDANFCLLHSTVKSLEQLRNANAANLIPDFRESLQTTAYPITVFCILKESTPDESVQSCTNQFVSALSMNALSSDFKKILDKADFSDISLQVKEESIKAHKMVLQARSPVFGKMFLHDNGDVVDITDLKPITVKRFLNYLYSGVMEEVGFEEILELYYAADKYEVMSLRDSCRSFLQKHIEVDNACTLFALANRHSDEALKKRVVSFICNNFRPVMKTKSFLELSRDDTALLMSMV